MLLSWCGNIQADIQRSAMGAHGKHFHGDREDAEDSEFLGRDKGVPGVGEKALQSPKVLLCPQYVQTQESRPRRCRRHHQLWLFCAILAPGGCGLLFPRERGSLFVSASPGESFPSGRMGLNSALGYVLHPPAVDGALPSAFCTWSLSMGLPCFVRITHGQIHLDKMKEEDELGRQEAFWQHQQLCWDVREVRVRP